MTEHMHEWTISIGGVFCIDSDCEAEMNFDKAECHLNAVEMLKKLYEETELYMLHMEPDVVAYKATPNLIPHATRVERFMTIMRDLHAAELEKK